MIAFDLASLSFGTSLLQRLQQFAPELSPRVRKCCLLLSKLHPPHDVGGQFDVSIEHEEKEEEQWELNTYVTCEVLAWRGAWTAEERRRRADLRKGYLSKGRGAAALLVPGSDPNTAIDVLTQLPNGRILPAGVTIIREHMHHRFALQLQETIANRRAL
jgi:hypothetical protein